MKISFETLLVLLFSGIAFVPQAQAIDTLPYSTRSHSYNGWFSSAQGDLRTVGMAGATTGLGDSFFAALDNTAGLAMTLQGANSALASNVVSDNSIQSSSKLNTFYLGAAVDHYPWGFSMGYSEPYTEGTSYLLRGSPNDPANLSISVKEFNFSVARVFFRNRLAIGASLILGSGEENIQMTQATSLSHQVSAFGIRGNLGAMLQLSNRVLIGLTYQTPLTYDINPLFNTSPTFSGFFQPIDLPPRLSLGLGWIPNRFFRADFTLLGVGISKNAALLRDDSIRVGEAITVQPRFGFSYLFSDYKELRGTLYLGGYYESSRIQGLSDRFHATSGVELAPWILQLGAALDTSANYESYILFVGIDVIKLMRKIDVVPEEWRPQPGGFFPNPSTHSSEGLPRPLVKNWKKHGKDIDYIQVGLNAPKKLEQKIKQVGKQVKEAFEALAPKKSDDSEDE